MSCVSLTGRAWLERLRAAAEDPRPVSTFRSPEATTAKITRIRLLAESSDSKVRESAALSYLAPAELLDKLAQDGDLGVRCCVARNERTSSDVLTRLASDPDPGVRGWVAANPGAQHLLESLAVDPDRTVRSVAAWAAKWSR